MKYDAIALGELLIDFTSSGVSSQGNPLFEANPGGAPGNVMAMLAKLGKKTGFVGKVGDDMFGRMLVQTVASAGIETGGIVIDNDANTTLAFVQNAPDGDREFSFFRKPGADTLLRPEEVSSELVQGCQIFHFGSLSLTDEPARQSTKTAVHQAKAAGALISFDPNLRRPLWRDLAEAKRQMAWGCSRCDVLKIADDELTFLTGHTDLQQGAAQIQATYPNVKLLLLTKSRNGAECFKDGEHVEKPTFLGVKTIDTTGAGDTFLGCCLAFVLEHGLTGLHGPLLSEMLLFANAASSLVTTKKGAILAMPARQEVLALLERGI